MAIKKIRVAELAKEIGLSNESCLAFVQSMGISAKSISSSIEEAQADRVRRKAVREGLITAGIVGRNLNVRQPRRGEASILTSQKRERWPLPSAYDDSLFDPNHWMKSPELKRMVVESVGVGGQSSIYQTGGFACVAKAQLDGEWWAIRLLYRQQVDLEERYRAIQARQDRGDLLDIMVPVEYRDDEIGVSGYADRYPVILVKWVEGSVLNEFVENACRKKDISSLRKLRSALFALESRMRVLHMAHGDLSGDNVMVTELNGQLNLKLLDYDSLWLPEIRDLKSSVGDGQMQHPGITQSSFGSIGSAADFVAFRLYDLGLQVLISNPDLGLDSSSFEHKFLVTQDEVVNHSSRTTQLMRQLDVGKYDDLVLVLKSPYDDLLERYQPLETAVGMANLNDKMKTGRIWTLASLVEVWDLSVGDIRKQASLVGITNEELIQGISSATAKKMAKSSHYVDLLNDQNELPTGTNLGDETWVEFCAEQFDLDEKFLNRVVGNWGIAGDAAVEVREQEKHLLYEFMNVLVSECTIDLEELGKRMAITDVHVVREEFLKGRDKWIVRKDGSCFVDARTSGHLSKLFSEDLAMYALAKDLSIDRKFLELVFQNHGLKSDFKSFIESQEIACEIISSKVRLCAIPLTNLIHQLDIENESNLKNSFIYGDDHWIVNQEGEWLIGSGTAAKWTKYFNTKRSQGTTTVSSIARGLSVTSAQVVQVIEDVVGIRGLTSDTEITEVQKRTIEKRIREDKVKYPVPLTTVVDQTDKLPGELLDWLRNFDPGMTSWVVRPYGVLMSAKVADLIKAEARAERAKKYSGDFVTTSVGLWDLCAEFGLTMTQLRSLIREVCRNEGVQNIDSQEGEITEWLAGKVRRRMFAFRTSEALENWLKWKKN